MENMRRAPISRIGSVCPFRVDETDRREGGSERKREAERHVGNARHIGRIGHMSSKCADAARPLHQVISNASPYRRVRCRMRARLNATARMTTPAAERRNAFHLSPGASKSASSEAMPARRLAGQCPGAWTMGETLFDPCRQHAGLQAGRRESIAPFCPLSASGQTTDPGARRMRGEAPAAHRNRRLQNSATMEPRINRRTARRGAVVKLPCGRRRQLHARPCKPMATIARQARPGGRDRQSSATDNQKKARRPTLTVSAPPRDASIIPAKSVLRT